MLFTSVPFALFLTLVFVLYWFVVKWNLKAQNMLLLVSSYVFYGWWDWRFLFLLFFVSLSNYILAIRLEKKPQSYSRKWLFIAGLFINIGTLVLFKYFNFFAEGLVQFLSLFGLKSNMPSLRILLPVGISFYIFLSISYLIDVYSFRLKPTRNVFDLLLAFSFFPILLAGPIQRPNTLLPQIQKRRVFEYFFATDGLRQILWGAFMKIVIADQCAETVDAIFADSSSLAGSKLILGIFLFTVQIYADFAGYSNIAIGIGKLFGFKIMQNFACPYFSRNIKEFWKRWNISLTTWFRDYVFLPVAYAVSRQIKSERCCLIKSEFIIYAVGLLITWTLIGLWHGASYTFIIWGALQGLLLFIHHLTIQPRKRILKRLNLDNKNEILIFFETLATFILIMFSWIFFRADNLSHALSYVRGIFSVSSFTIPVINPLTALLIVLFFFTEYLGRNQEYAIASIWLKWYKPARWIMYLVVCFTIIYFMGEEQQFLYFQF